jgi:hypothetical protein
VLENYQVSGIGQVTAARAGTLRMVVLDPVRPVSGAPRGGIDKFPLFRDPARSAAPST